MDRYTDIRNELDNDPLGRGYGSMTDEEITSDMNLEYRVRSKERMSGAELMDLIVKSEFNSRNVNAQNLIWNIVHLQDFDPEGVVSDLFLDAFTPGSTTAANFNAAKIESISRSVELGLGHVVIGDIQNAKAL